MTVSQRGETLASAVNGSANAKEWTPRSTIVVIGAALALLVAAGPLVLSTNGIFIRELEKEFGWGRGPISTGLLVAGILSSIVLPFIGKGIDRWGVKKVAPPLIVLFALNLAAFALTPANLGVYIFLVALIGIVSPIQSPSTYFKTIARWFDRRRGIAIGIIICGMAVGQSLMPGYTQWLVANVGWRGAYVGLAAILIVVGLGSVLFLIRDPRRNEGVVANRSSLASIGGNEARTFTGLSVKEALRNAVFWRLLAAVAIIALVIQGALVHVIPLLGDLGWDPATAAATMGLAGIASIGGRLGGGYCYDKFNASVFGSIAVLLGVVGIAVLATGVSPVLGIILIGVSAGAETDLIAFLTSRFFGLKSYGQLSAIMFSAFGIGAAFGPMFLGFGYDAMGDYRVMLTIYAVVLVSAAVLILTLPRKYPYGVGQE